MFRQNILDLLYLKSNNKFGLNYYETDPNYNDYSRESALKVFDYVLLDVVNLSIVHK